MSPADPEKLSLLTFIISLVSNSKWIELASVFVVLYAPGIAKAIWGLFAKDKVTKAHEALVRGKQEEIDRLAEQVKTLQNELLKRRR